MENNTFYISILFILTTAWALFIFYKAINRSRMILTILLAWLAFQGALSTTGFYTITNHVPPRFIWLVLPPLICIVFLFVSARGRKFLDQLNFRMLTLYHLIRIPVEFVLLGLYIYKGIPRLMTFEGRNFDILAGLSVPLIYYLVWVSGKMGKKAFLVWNFVCLALLLNIVVNAVLSAPFPFQQFGFDQPNIAVLFFPFVWLPCFLVPVALFAHLATIRSLLLDKTGVWAQRPLAKDLRPLQP